jgi:predicted nuclease of predicted toxin-antitoxin system
MLKLLIDQDFDHDILRGLVRRIPNLDAVTTFEAGLSTAPDPDLLAWADDANRVIVTHDRRTMPAHAARRMNEGRRVFGVVVVPRRLQIGNVINDLEIMVMCSDDDEWENIVRYLPLTK